MDQIANTQQILCVFLLCLCVTASSAQHPFHRSIPHEDVTRQCESFLSSATALTADADVLLHELPFANGDWHQEAGPAPLLIFPGSNGCAYTRVVQDTSRLATFTLTHVDTVHRQRASRLALNVSGVLSLTARSICCCSPASDPQHQHAPLGVARLDIRLEGLYTETASGGYGGGGERVLCMVGNALPMRGGNITCPCDDGKKKNVDGDSNDDFQPPPVIDDCTNMRLVLRYPKAQTLTSRAVRGKMMSTRAKSDSAYFDTVWLASQRDHFSRIYQFRPEEEEELVATAGCSTRSFDDVSEDVPICDILRDNENTALAVVPNWECNSTDEFFCGRLGPFTSGDKVMYSPNRALFKDFVITMQGLRCQQTTGLDGKRAALVSAVFRAVPPWEGLDTAVRRTGLSGMTLSAEGVWRASTGQLCMMGCLGTGTCKACCQHRVSLHVPTTFSLTRRSILVGQITSLDGSNFPLSFQRALHPRQSGNKVGRSHSEEWLRMAYSYEKVEQAMELLRRSKTSCNLVANAKSLLMSYPNKVHGSSTGGDEMMSLSDLSEDLGLNFRLVSKLQSVPEWIKGDSFQLQIVSIGPLVGMFQSGRPPSTPVVANNDIKQQQQEILNVSAAFTASEDFSGPVISLEGVYNPEDGKMHLIGCRHVEAPWRVLSKMGDLESGMMDCSIEVKVEYPPTKMRWLFSPAMAKFHMSSARPADDPLHFNVTELQSLPVFYRRDIRSSSSAFVEDDNMEGVLCIAMLSANIVTALSQLRYMKSHPDVVPYISLAMLGAQALGYSAALVTADAKKMIMPTAAAAAAWRWRPTYDGYRTDTHGLHHSWDMVDGSVRALALAALLLTLRIARKVRRARARSPPREPARVPSDRVPLLCAHLGVLLFVLAVHYLDTSGMSTTTVDPQTIYYEARAEPYTPPSRAWGGSAVVERYVGVAKEWFLLPQVIGNAMWRVNCRPLRKGYYAGVTGMWLLLHVYGFLILRPSAANMYPRVLDVPQDDAMGFYSDVTGVVVPLVGAVLALSVYLQQRWNYKVLGRAIARNHKKLQHVC